MLKKYLTSPLYAILSGLFFLTVQISLSYSELLFPLLGACLLLWGIWNVKDIPELSPLLPCGITYLLLLWIELLLAAAPENILYDCFQFLSGCFYFLFMYLFCRGIHRGCQALNIQLPYSMKRILSCFLLYLLSVAFCFLFTSIFFAIWTFALILYIFYMLFKDCMALENVLFPHPAFPLRRFFLITASILLTTFMLLWYISAAGSNHPDISYVQKQELAPSLQQQLRKKGLSAAAVSMLTEEDAGHLNLIQSLAQQPLILTDDANGKTCQGILYYGFDERGLLNIAAFLDWEALPARHTALLYNENNASTGNPTTLPIAQRQLYQKDGTTYISKENISSASVFSLHKGEHRQSYLISTVEVPRDSTLIDAVFTLYYRNNTIQPSYSDLQTYAEQKMFPFQSSNEEKEADAAFSQLSGCVTLDIRKS